MFNKKPKGEDRGEGMRVIASLFLFAGVVLFFIGIKGPHFINHLGYVSVVISGFFNILYLSNEIKIRNKAIKESIIIMENLKKELIGDGGHRQVNPLGQKCLACTHFNACSSLYEKCTNFKYWVDDAK